MTTEKPFRYWTVIQIEFDTLCRGVNSNSNASPNWIWTRNVWNLARPCQLPPRYLWARPPPQVVCVARHTLCALQADHPSSMTLTLADFGLEAEYTLWWPSVNCRAHINERRSTFTSASTARTAWSNMTQHAKSLGAPLWGLDLAWHACMCVNWLSGVRCARTRQIVSGIFSWRTVMSFMNEKKSVCSKSEKWFAANQTSADVGWNFLLLSIIRTAARDQNSVATLESNNKPSDKMCHKKRRKKTAGTSHEYFTQFYCKKKKIFAK